MDPPSFTQSSSQNIDPHVPQPPEDIEMTDANGQVLPDMGPYPVLLADHRLPLPQQNIPHRPLLPPIDTDLDDLPLQSFDTSYTSSSSHSDSALFHSFSGPPAIQSASQHFFLPHLSNSPSSAPARFNPIPERLTRQLPDVPPRSPAYVPSSTLQNSPTIPSKQMLLAEFQAGQINSRANAAGSWELECPRYRCSTWINANIDSNRPLMIEGHFTPLHNHMKGGNCGANKSRSISRSPSLTRHPSVASLSSHHSPSSSTSSPNLSRGLSVPPSPSPYSPRALPPQFPSTASSFTFSSTSSPTLPRGQSVPPLPFSPRSGPSPLPSADMPLPFASFSHDTRYNHQRSPQSISELHASTLNQSAPANIESTTRNLCSGVVVEWPLDLDLNCNETFPFHRVPIGRSLGDVPFFIEIHNEGEKIIAWSKSCTRRPTPYASCCHECGQIPSRLEKLANIATRAEKGTNYKYLNHKQLKELLVERTKENNDLKLQSLNMSRQLATFARKMGDYERLIMAIATNDVPRINALLSTAIRNGASVNTIIAQIVEAVQGLRSTKGFTKFELDLSILIYRIGGNSLLYSLNHALGLPSLRTINNSANFVKITPTFGPVTIEVIRENIKKVILEPRALAGKMRKQGGVVFMMDEVAIEEHLDYFPKENKVGGLCQKHSATTPLTLQTYKSALTIVDKLRAEEVHFGKEMALVAVRFAHEKDIYPILVYPTCKGETVEDMQRIYTLLMQAWEELGEPVFGDIRNFATDGDQLRRQVGYKMFCTEELPRDHPLFPILSNLPGLNLFTGPKLILQTFDWRHIIKRDSTLVRQPSGMCVDAGRVVNPHFLGQCLQLLEKHDEKTVHKLLNPDDPQDVPRAIDLIEAIISLREVEPPTYDVDLTSTCDSVRLLGHVLESFTLPFISPDFSLGKQIRMLSTCAHLMFILFREYRLDFMSNQLYGDTQSTIKNIVFSVAKQQLQDPDVDVNANEDGTDPVEGHFSFMRTTGGHNSAMNYKQGVERSGWACDIQGVYGRWPHLQQQSRRRRVTRTEHKDHLNSRKWDADLKAGNCEIIDDWAMGQIDAIAIFRDSGKLAPEAYDFPKILATPGVDFLRPWGQNYYPGVAVDNDRSVVEPTRTAAPQATDTSNPVPLDPVPLDPVPLDPGTDSESDEEQIEQAQETEDPEPITLLDIIDDEPEPLDLAPGPGIRLNNYVADENGKPIHKASICRLVLNKEFVAKSKNRTDRAAGLGLGRVRCFTKVESRSLKAAGSGNMTGPAFITGDMFLTLVQHGKRVSMAILKSTTILQDGRVVRDIAAATITNVQANVKLTGQIVHLEAVKTTPDDIVEGGNSNAPALEESWTWLCTGTFLTRTSKMKATGILTTKPVVLTVPGVLVELVNPPVVDAQGRLSEQAAKGLNSAGTTWALHHPPLCFLLAQLSQRLNEASTVLRAVPKVNESSHFPYKSASGEVALQSEAGTALVAAKLTQGCLYCPEVPKNWRAHIGAHLLRRLRGSGEPQAQAKKKLRTENQIPYPQVGDSLPCGFCGRSGRPECQVFMKPNSKKNDSDMKTKCQYSVNFQYKTADEGKSKGACRNVPIICGLCPDAPRKNDAVPAVWRYNMAEHLRTHHAEYASPQQPEGLPLPYAVWQSMEITREEEIAMGVKEDLVPRKFTQVAPAVAGEVRADGGETLKRSTAPSGGNAAKRGRR